jgi:hypothetical protein
MKRLLQCRLQKLRKLPRTSRRPAIFFWVPTDHFFSGTPRLQIGSALRDWSKKLNVNSPPEAALVFFWGVFFSLPGIYARKQSLVCIYP